jgi:hypothetical protein
VEGTLDERLGSVREALRERARKWFISSKSMDQHHATVWTGVVAALLTAPALLFTTTADSVLRGVAFGCAGGALYVISSLFVPLPLVKTWTQPAAPDVLSAAGDRGRFRVQEMRAVGRGFVLAAAHSPLSRG